jgi:hypothetical protein
MGEIVHDIFSAADIYNLYLMEIQRKYMTERIIYILGKDGIKGIKVLECRLPN